MTVRSSGPYRGAMVGREHQLARAISFFSELETGDSPGLLCYWAPAGIGKTRLVREIDAALPDTEFIFIEADQAPGTDPVADFFRAWFNLDAGVSEKKNSENFRHLWEGLLLNLELRTDYPVHQLIDELMDARPFLESISGLYQKSGSIVHQLEPSQRAERISTSIASFFLALSILQPVVVVIENIQWFSRESILILERLFRTASGFPLGFIATGRPDSTGSQPVFPSAASASGSDIVFLSGLSKKDITSFVEELTGVEPELKLVDFLWDRAGGVPLFLEQALDYLIETKQVNRRGDHLDLRWSATEITESIKDMFLARVRMMPTSVQKIAGTASLLGKTFNPDVLAEVTESENIENELESCVQKHIFTVEGFSISFAHMVFREWAFELIPSDEHEKLHLRAGKILEVLHEGSTSASHLEGIASHFQLGGDNLKAAIYIGKAAETYADNFENSAAIALYGRLASMVQDPERTEADLDLAGVYRNAGLLNEGIDLLTSTMKRISGDPLIDDSLKARVMLKLGTNLGSSGKLKQAEKMLRSCLETFSRMADVRHMSIATQQLGLIARTAGRTEEAVTLGEESVDLARKSGIPLEICASLYWVAITYRQLGQYDLMKKCTEEQVRLAQETGLIKSIIAGYDNLMRVHIYNRDYDSAEDVHKKLRKAAEKTANWAALSTATSKLGIIHLRRAEWEQAIDCFMQCVTLSIKTGNLRAKCAALGNLAHASIEIGNTDAALKYATELIDTASVIGFRSGLMSGYARMGYIFSLKGDYESALDCVQTQIEHAEAIGDKRNLSEGWSAIALIQLLLDEPAAAIESINIALENSRKANDMVSFSGQLGLRGKILSLKGEFEKAEKDLREALDLNDGRKGREKFVYNSRLYLAVIQAEKGDENASAKLLEMLENAPDRNYRAETLYHHWKLTGNSESASAGRMLLEEIHQDRPQPIIKKWLDLISAEK
ncbi:MAG: AAA family ATPase [Candidatus Aegiribacteria sp.]|nr:AAA family ATPase [Candidatus Aegiribacteria sp.]